MKCERKVQRTVFLVMVLLYVWLLQVHCYNIETYENGYTIAIKCESNENLDSLKQIKSNINKTKTPFVLVFTNCPPPKTRYLDILKEINIDASQVSEIHFQRMVDTDFLMESLFMGMPLTEVSVSSSDGKQYDVATNSTGNIDLAYGSQYDIDCSTEGYGLINRKPILPMKFLNVPRVKFSYCTPPNVPFSDILQNLNINPVSVEQLQLTNADSSLNYTSNHFKGLSLRKLEVVYLNFYNEFNSKIFEEIAVDEILLHQVVLNTLPKSRINKVTLNYGKFIGEWGDCSTLTTLILKRCIVPEIPGGWLRQCHRLTELRLVSLTQKVVDQTLIGAHALTTLKIENCKYAAVTKPIAGDAVNLRTLIFEDETLRNLTVDAFSKFKKLEELQLFAMRVNVYDVLVAITPLENLRNLTFYDHSGTFCGDYRNYQSHYLPLNPAQRNFALRVERVSFPDSLLFHMCFEDWKNLTYLDLSNNGISELQLLNLPVPREHPLTINLISNELNIPNDLDYVTMTEYFKGSQNITILLDITVECDCENSWLVWALRNLPQMSLQSVTCSDEKQRFMDFAAKSVGCNKYSCDNCTCRTSWDDGATVADCNSRELRTLPKIRSSLMTSSEIRNKVFVKKILASGNFIETLPEFDNMDTSIEVDLRYNNISRISEGALNTFFSGGNLMNLSGNPLVCECETQDMLNVLSKYRDQVPDYKDLTCSYSNRKSVLHKLADRSLCTERALIAFGIVSLTLLAFAAISAFIFVRYKLTIKAFLYARGLCLSCVREEELDADREYDAFVSYAHPDDEFVADVLLPRIENDYKLCVHTRNWMPGEMIHTQIMESVQKSRRTIIVLSKSFVESIWGMTEFRTAYSNSLREGRVRLICIVVDDVIDDANLDSELKSYLKSNTYLKYEDPWFWQKLRYAMPHPRVTSDQSGAQNQNEENRRDEIELASI